MSSNALNLESICRGIEAHNKSCEFPALEITMNPFEVERLGWDEIKGIPIVGDSAVPTGRFKIVCDASNNKPLGVEVSEKVTA